MFDGWTPTQKNGEKLPRHDGLSSSDSKSPAPVLRRSRMTETQAMPQSRFSRRWKSDGKMWKKWLSHGNIHGNVAGNLWDFTI